jgi:PAS domain S-box-containing protein
MEDPLTESQQGETRALTLKQCRDLVERLSVPALLVELPTLKVVAVSGVAEAFLDVSGTGTDVLTETEAGKARLVLLAEANIHGYCARVEVVGKSGTTLPAELNVQRLDLPDTEQLALIIITLLADPSGPESTAKVADCGASAFRKHRIESVEIIGTVDRDWHIARLSSDAFELLGLASSDWVGKGFLSWLHPDDLGNVLMGVGQAFNVDASVTLRARLRHVDGSWLPVSMVVAPLVGSGGAEFAFVAQPLPCHEIANSSSAERVALLEQRLWRIALEVKSAGIVQELRRLPDHHQLPQLGELSARQFEVLTHLVNGQRVPAIALSMSVSQSTIRNHLSAIYHKLGVHSQSELVDLLHGLDEPEDQM